MTFKKKVNPDTTKNEEETTEEVQEETQETTEEESNEDESSSSKETEVDYKALLIAEKERAEKAEKALASDRYNASKQKREEQAGEQISSDDEDNKPLTKKDLQALLQKERQETRKTFEEQRALEIARGSTTSEDEAQAALLYWRTRVIPTGNLEEDMLFAIGGLNNRKTAARNAELIRALRSKDGVSHDTASTHRDAVSGGVPKLSADDAASYKRAGFTYDTSSKVWKKKLPNGKFLVKDPRTKQTSVQ